MLELSRVFIQGAARLSVCVIIIVIVSKIYMFVHTRERGSNPGFDGVKKSFIIIIYFIIRVRVNKVIMSIWFKFALFSVRPCEFYRSFQLIYLMTSSVDL